MAKRILIVDDAAFMRMTLKDILTKAGYDVVGEAENGKQGVAMYSELSPDVVAMNITMPEMDGIAATKAIKTINADADILIISAMGQGAMVVEAIEAGAGDFVVKPFQSGILLQKLHGILHNRRVYTNLGILRLMHFTEGILTQREIDVVFDSASRRPNDGIGKFMKASMEEAVRAGKAEWLTQDEIFSLLDSVSEKEEPPPTPPSPLAGLDAGIDALVESHVLVMQEVEKHGQLLQAMLQEQREIRKLLELLIP